MRTFKALSTVGCYYRDADGVYWATFIGHIMTCGDCGQDVRTGYVQSALTKQINPPEYVCGCRVNVVYPDVGINERVRE